MRILYLCSKVYWDAKVPRTRFHVIHQLSKMCDLSCNGVGFDFWDESSSISENLDPNAYDAIFVYKPEQYTGWGDVSTSVVTSFNDAWHVEQRTSDIEIPKCKAVVMHHKNEVSFWEERFPDVKFWNIPYPINERVFKDYEQEKTCDILLTGAIDKTIYPLRDRFKRMIKTGAFGQFRCTHRNHPGYRIADPEKEAIDYAKAINSSRICLADTSKYGYAPEKYHEIPACNSVLCGNLPQERQGEFSEFMIQIDESWSDSDIVSVITSHLNETEKLESMSTAGFEYVHSNFTMLDYCSKFLSLLEDIR